MSKPILITGAGKRVGLHLARQLMKAEYDLVVHYHSHTEAIDEFKEQDIPVIQGDFDRPEGIHDFINRVKDITGDLRGIIHNASMYSNTSPELEKASEQFSNFFHVHMMAPYLINEGLLDRLEGTKSSPADIIALTDMYVNRPEPRIDTYSATKAGLKNLVESGAKKYAPGVKVNAIEPGPVLFGEDADQSYRENVLNKTPMEREGGPESIFDVVKMILENDFLTGTHIPVDGGRRLT